MRSSPMPARGPDAYQRTSFAIFINAAASVRIAPLAAAIASCADSAATWLLVARNGWPVSAAMCLDAVSLKRGCAFKPVPTAVAPNASS